MWFVLIFQVILLIAINNGAETKETVTRQRPNNLKNKPQTAGHIPYWTV